METKETPTIVMQEKVKADFEKWKCHNYNTKWCTEFDRMPFDFQSGVITAYLRDNGVETWVFPWPYKTGVYVPEVCNNGKMVFIESNGRKLNYVAALTSAINEGLRIVEEQLKDKP